MLDILRKLLEDINGSRSFYTNDIGYNRILSGNYRKYDVKVHLNYFDQFVNGHLYVDGDNVYYVSFNDPKTNQIIVKQLKPRTTEEMGFFDTKGRYNRIIMN